MLRPTVALLLWGTTLLGAGAAHGQQLGDAHSRVVLLPTPHAPPESEIKLSSRLAAAIAQGVRKRIAHIPYTVVRAAPAAEASCAVTDYECKVKASRSTAKASCAATDEDCKVWRSERAIDWVADIQVQDNANGTYYIVSFLYDVEHPDNTIDDKSSFGTPGSGRQLSSVAEEALVAQIAERVAGLFQRAPKGAQPAVGEVAAQPAKPPHGQALSLEVTVVGPGRIVSQPPGITCARGSSCRAEFPATGELHQVTLRAEPTGAAGAVIWSGSPCQNSILADPRRCDLPISGSLKVTAGFERSSSRKIATGVLGGLAGAGLVVSAVMLGLTGRNAGGCVDRGVSYDTGCVYNLAAPGLLTVGLTVGLGVGAALAWWLPTARESK